MSISVVFQFLNNGNFVLDITKYHATRNTMLRQGMRKHLLQPIRLVL